MDETNPKQRRTPETAAEQVLHEVEDAELRLDRDETDRDDGEAADTLTPSRPAQESARKHHRADGAAPGRPKER